MKIFLALLALIFSLSWALPAAPATAPTDDELTDQVKVRIARAVPEIGASVQVDVKNGVATLRGNVRTEKQLHKAEGSAKKVKGIKQVVNELKIEKHPTFQ